MNKLDNAAIAIGSLSCLMLLGSALSACSDMRTTEEKLLHLAVECVYTADGKVCKEDKDASISIPVTTP